MIQYVVFHEKGPQWSPGLPAQEQPGIVDHQSYYLHLAREKIVEMAGPFLNDAEDSPLPGMVVLAPSQDRAAAERLAAADPAVKSGLIKFFIKPWFLAVGGAS